MKRLFKKTKNTLRTIRHARVRAKIAGTKDTPRLSVFRSLKGMTVQLIDDGSGKTLVYVNTGTLKKVKVEGKTGKVAVAYALGEKLAEAAKEKGITKIVFDRGGYRYHGRVAALAEGARAGGLQF